MNGIPDNAVDRLVEDGEFPTREEFLQALDMDKLINRRKYFVRKNDTKRFEAFCPNLPSKKGQKSAYKLC